MTEDDNHEFPVFLAGRDLLDNYFLEQLIATLVATIPAFDTYGFLDSLYKALEHLPSPPADDPDVAKSTEAYLLSYWKGKIQATERAIKMGEKIAEILRKEL